MEVQNHPPAAPEGDLDARIRRIVREEMEKPKPVEERLTLRQAAQLLGVNGDTLTRYRKAGRVVAYRDKGQVYLLKHEVEAANITPRGKAAPLPPNSTNG